MNLTTLDKGPLWHPYTQEKTAANPILIKKAIGAYYYTEDGKKIFDGISSWWVNLFGHGHPLIKEAINRQFDQIDQIILAGHTHRPAIELSKKIINLLPYLSKVFFSDNGSTSVEVALKMALQYWSNQGTPKNHIISFKGAYHGDTFGARAVSNSIPCPLNLSQNLTKVSFIDPPLLKEKSDSVQQLKNLIRENKDIGAFIFEPMVQGVAGMRMMDPMALNDLLIECKKNNILCIADEVMTGFYRTGKLFATDYLNEKPDIVCLSKGITGGVLPLAVTVCTLDIYEKFYSTDLSKAFLYGHSYTGNAISCAAALASLDILMSDNTKNSIAEISRAHQKFIFHFSKNNNLNKKVNDIRSLGTILAIEFKTNENSDYFNGFSHKISRFFLEKNLLLRPLGNVLYMIPPYCSTNEDLQMVYEAILQFTNKLPED